MASWAMEAAGREHVAQGMTVVDRTGQVVGSVRDHCGQSFLLSRTAQRDVVWVSKRAIEHAEGFRLTLACSADELGQHSI